MRRRRDWVLPRVQLSECSPNHLISKTRSTRKRVMSLYTAMLCMDESETHGIQRGMERDVEDDQSDSPSVINLDAYKKSSVQDIEIYWATTRGTLHIRAAVRPFQRLPVCGSSPVQPITFRDVKV
jgi:hypothetical protein